jgi:hypothetical protein
VQRTHWAVCLILLAGAACSSRPPTPAGPTPTPEPTIRPLPEPVQAKVQETLDLLKRDLSLEPAQEARIRTHLENALGRVYQLSTVPLASERGRAQMIKLTVDQFERDLLGLLSDDQVARWEAIRASTRASLSRISAPPATRTPAAPPR